MPRVFTELLQATDTFCTVDRIFVQIVGQRDQLVARFGPLKWYCSMFIQRSEDHQVILKVDHCLQRSQHQNGPIPFVQGVHCELAGFLVRRDALVVVLRHLSLVLLPKPKSG